MNKNQKTCISLYESKDTDYTDLLEATGAAFRHVIRSIIFSLQLMQKMAVLDVGVGIGYDLIDLADMVCPAGKVVGVEISEPHFAKALQTIEASVHKEQIEVRLCDINNLEYPDETFDLVWCKYTLACFLDPLSSLQKMKQFIKKGGRGVVINDLVPMHWLPGTLLGEDRARESRLYTALFQNIADYRSRRREELGCSKIYNTSCAGLMKQAGFTHLSSYTVVAEEAGELSEALKKVLHYFLKRSFPDDVKDYISAADWEFIQEMRNPDSPAYLLNRQDMHVIKPITALIGYKYE